MMHRNSGQLVGAADCDGQGGRIGRTLVLACGKDLRAPIARSAQPKAVRHTDRARCIGLLSNPRLLQAQ